MGKYQPEDPYQPLNEKAYVGPLKALTVLRLKVENPIFKKKMGQHLTTKQRAKVYKRLRERSFPGDRVVGHSMTLANPDLREDGWVEALNRAQLKSVAGLLAGSYWAQGRSNAEQSRLNRTSELVVAKCEGDSVLAFARVAWVSPSRAYLADVIVAKHARGQGLGKELMRRVMEHPRVKATEHMMLVTKDAQALYQKFNFGERFTQGSSFMTRWSRETNLLEGEEADLEVGGRSGNPG